MNDIVDRLRCTALIRAIHRSDNDPIKLESLEAANEIERLRAALAEAGCDHCRHWFDRAALEGL